MMAVAATALGFSSCSETWDGNPVLKTYPEAQHADFLNTPVLTNEYILLTDDTRDGTFHLTCSQPDYGYAAIATYKVQVCLSDKFEEAQTDADGNITPANYIELTQGFTDCANINPLNHDMASAIESLHGITKENELDRVADYQPVYVRLRSYIAQDEANTVFLSNVVKFENVAINYLAVWIAGESVDLYVRGGMNDWGAVPEWQFKTGETENTWIIENVTIEANTSIKVSNSAWGFPNLGGNAGENEDSQMIDEGVEYAMTLGDNPGHMRMDKKFTGNVVLRLENGVYYITFVPAEAAE